MNTLRALRDHWLTTWLILAIPGIALIRSAATDPSWHDLLHISGEFSARLLVITLVLTPLRTVLPTWRLAAWLMARRRWLGVAAFGYAALHLAFYGIHEGLWTELAQPEILTGWLAFLIFVPLALTSNHASVVAMGRSWKRLQRGAYLAAVFTVLHWFLLEYEVVPALVHFMPVVLLRGWAWNVRHQPGPPSHR